MEQNINKKPAKEGLIRKHTEGCSIAEERGINSLDLSLLLKSYVGQPKLISSLHREFSQKVRDNYIDQGMLVNENGELFNQGFKKRVQPEFQYPPIVNSPSLATLELDNLLYCTGDENDEYSDLSIESQSVEFQKPSLFSMLGNNHIQMPVRCSEVTKDEPDGINIKTNLDSSIGKFVKCAFTRNTNDLEVQKKFGLDEKPGDHLLDVLTPNDILYSQLRKIQRPPNDLTLYKLKI